LVCDDHWHRIISILLFNDKAETHLNLFCYAR
jgi:hypothetical protein